MYRVIRYFTDLQDDNYRYDVGDEYPRLGLKPSLARIVELSGSNNKQKAPLIEEVPNLPGYVPEIETAATTKAAVTEIKADDDQPEIETTTKPKRGRKKQEK